MSEGYIFHCTPCGKAHAGECPPAGGSYTLPAAALTGNRTITLDANQSPVKISVKVDPNSTIKAKSAIDEILAACAEQDRRTMAEIQGLLASMEMGSYNARPTYLHQCKYDGSCGCLGDPYRYNCLSEVAEHYPYGTKIYAAVQPFFMHGGEAVVIDRAVNRFVYCDPGRTALQYQPDLALRTLNAALEGPDLEINEDAPAPPASVIEYMKRELLRQGWTKAVSAQNELSYSMVVKLPTPLTFIPITFQVASNPEETPPRLSPEPNS
jgi:hypothetical protein